MPSCKDPRCMLAVGLTLWTVLGRALFTFSMLPDPKTCPPTRRGRVVWALSIAVTDGVLRYLEIRYSMFYALFAHCAILPGMRALAARAGIQEREVWRILRFPFGRRPG